MWLPCFGTRNCWQWQHQHKEEDRRVQCEWRGEGPIHSWRCKCQQSHYSQKLLEVNVKFIQKFGTSTRRGADRIKEKAVIQKRICLRCKVRNFERTGFLKQAVMYNSICHPPFSSAVRPNFSFLWGFMGFLSRCSLLGKDPPESMSKLTNRY